MTRGRTMASISRLPNGKYRPRYRDEHGKEHARHFDRKVDAQRWLDEVTGGRGHRHLRRPRRGPADLHRVLRRVVFPTGVAPATETAMSLAARSTTFADVQMRDPAPLAP